MFALRAACLLAVAGASGSDLAGAMDVLSAGAFDGLQAQMDGVAKYFNTSIQLSVRWGEAETSSVSFASGVEDRASGTTMTVDSMVPLGSATKPWTTVAALRLAEAGKIDLDAPAWPLVDPFLGGNATLEAVYGVRGTSITLRQLVGMRAGVQDYDDGLFRRKVFRNASFDYEPELIVSDANHTLLCDPGTCGAYSSVGYILAGFALANASGVADWRDFDQKAAALGAYADDFNSTLFPKDGPCSAYPVVHQYAGWFDESKKQYGTFDVSEDSCLNGWTCGNIAASSHDLAKFWYLLFTGKLVSSASLKAMLDFKPLTTGWSTGLPYGLGAMISGWKQRDGNYSSVATIFGHGGEDYGSETELNGFVPALNMSINFAMGSEIGMNCTNSIGSNYNAKGQAACYIYDQVLQAISPKIPRLECGLDDTRRAFAADGDDWTCFP